MLLKIRRPKRKEESNMVLSDVDMMVESILIAMEEHGCVLSGRRWLTAKEVVALPEAEIISLFNQIYGRD